MHRTTNEPLRIVAIGGGTGLSTLLRGLKRYARAEGTQEARVEITAVVTVTDDGGSSGRLRREFDILPPGDIRNCMVALAEDEEYLSRVFQYRFAAGRGLKGHSFGNLFLTALTDVTGDFAQAVKVSSDILKIAGRIYPATSSNIVLEATLENGTVVRGETKISKSKARIQSIRFQPEKCKPAEETIAAIAAADLITFGPGSLFTSVIPNILVEGVPEAICDSGALRVYFSNLMWQPGETNGLLASDHARAILDHAGRKVIDYVILNNAEIRRPLLRKYARQKACPVVNDIETLKAMGLRTVEAPLAIVAAERQVVRHDSDKTAEIVMQLAEEGRALKRRREKARAS